MPLNNSQNSPTIKRAVAIVFFVLIVFLFNKLEFIRLMASPWHSEKSFPSALGSLINCSSLLSKLFLASLRQPNNKVVVVLSRMRDFAYICVTKPKIALT